MTLCENRYIVADIGELRQKGPIKTRLEYQIACDEGAHLIVSGAAEVPDMVDLLTDAAVGRDHFGCSPEGTERDLGAALDAARARQSTSADNGDLDKLALELDATQRGKVTALTIDEFLSREYPLRETMIAPWLPKQGLAMLHGFRGYGKTQIAHGCGWAAAVGGGFLKWQASRPWRVLLLDGEMPAADLQLRLRPIQQASEKRPEPGFFQIAAADTFPDGLPDLASPQAQQLYADVVGEADLVIVDNLSTLCRAYKENDADSWAPIQGWALKQRRAGRSVLLIHHDGKGGQQRGTSAKEDVLDTVISLRRPPDYSADQGCRMEVRFTKSRGFHGPEAEPFEARLVGHQWSLSGIKTGDDDDTLRTLRTQGLSIRDIAERTGLPKSTIHRRLEGKDE